MIAQAKLVRKQRCFQPKNSLPKPSCLLRAFIVRFMSEVVCIRVFITSNGVVIIAAIEPASAPEIKFFKNTEFIPAVNGPFLSFSLMVQYTAVNGMSLKSKFQAVGKLFIFNHGLDFGFDYFCGIRL